MNNDNGILNELRELSPELCEVLARLKQDGSQPFRVPEGYFNELKSDVFTHIESGLAEGIGKEEDHAAFKVPENYFEDLSSDIMRKIEAEEVIEGGKVINLQDARKREPIPQRRWTMMAASVAFFILLGVLAARFTGIGGIDPMDMTAFNEITQEEALDYLAGNLDESKLELDSDDLLALVDFSDTDLSLDVTDDLEEELNEYLDENIDDLEEYLLTVEI